MLTVTRLAETCGLSRSTLLYYESIGLLQPARRSAANYRAYGERDAQRLRQICMYRDAGLKLEDIRAMLDSPASDAAEILERRLGELNTEVETLRQHQQSIVRLMRKPELLRRAKVMTKEKWVSIMKAAGFTPEAMHRWHVEFERAAPQDHQEFLESLHIAPDEVKAIRKWSAGGAGLQPAPAE
jgi:DNA-binding transcriptional MerR regulator